MTPRRENVEELFAQLRAEPLPPSALDAQATARVVDGIGRALGAVAERRRSRGRWRRAAAGLSLAASVGGVGVGSWFAYRDIGAGVGVGQVVSPSEVIDRRVSVRAAGDVTMTDLSGRSVALGEPSDPSDPKLRLDEGYRLRTEEGTARLGFASGAAAQVSSGSTLTVTATRSTEALFLARGNVDVEVPKLDAQRGFSVATPDALVTVHGTRFSVHVEDSAGLGPRTHVKVDHGVVSVEHAGHEVRLLAGDAWPPASPSEDRATPEQDASAAELERALLDEAHARDSREPRPRPKARAAARRRVSYDSRELADQNQRFAAALRMRKAGAGGAALAELAGLIERYPESPLRQEVLVQRLRLLAALGRTEEAREEARAYLEEFPHGYAKVEALELLEGRH